MPCCRLSAFAAAARAAVVLKVFYKVMIQTESLSQKEASPSYSVKEKKHRLCLIRRFMVG